MYYLSPSSLSYRHCLVPAYVQRYQEQTARLWRKYTSRFSALHSSKTAKCNQPYKGQPNLSGHLGCEEDKQGLLLVGNLICAMAKTSLLTFQQERMRGEKVTEYVVENVGDLNCCLHSGFPGWQSLYPLNSRATRFCRLNHATHSIDDTSRGKQSISMSIQKAFAANCSAKIHFGGASCWEHTSGSTSDLQSQEIGQTCRNPKLDSCVVISASEGSNIPHRFSRWHRNLQSPAQVMCGATIRISFFSKKA